MVLPSEQLLETLLDLERSRQIEREIRLEAEALLEGLRGMGEAHEQQDLFQSLVLAMRTIIDFEEAFILRATRNAHMAVLATTLPAIHEGRWMFGPVFAKAIAGKPVASFDICQVPEWQDQPPVITTQVRSALHIGMRGQAWEAILVLTHSQAKHFGPSQVKKAMRFSPLASQALLTLELRKALLERDRFYQLSLDAMAIFTADGTITQHNQGWSDFFGRAEQQGCNILAQTHPDDSQHFQSLLAGLGSTQGNHLITTRLRDQAGQYRWFSCSIAVYAGQMLYYIVARDITESVLFEQRLAYQAGHDSLTGLKNRAEFMECLKAAFTRYQDNPNLCFALLFLDLNKFKAINDTHGHDIGDALLKAFAATLKEAVRSEDIVSRLGGDEFTIILSKIKAITDIESVTQRIRELCSTPYLLKGLSIQASASIGIALSGPEFRHEEEMMHAADLAMYTAKQDTSLPYFIHHGPMHCDLDTD